MDINNKKVLIVYFSRQGENYYNGKIVDLKVGNTEVAANMISKLTNSDIFEIKSIEEYPKDYNQCTKIAQVELNENKRPVLVSDIDTNEYEVIYLGYPNWWGTMPMPVWTFLDNHSFDGKVIYPFCTHEGSGIGNSERDLRKLCPNSKIKKGLAIHGSSVKTSESIIKNWIMKG